MGRHAEITQPWADGEYSFRLGLKELVEHDEKCNAGPAWVARALMDGTWRLPFIRETIRLGLIGAGKLPSEALVLVKRYVDDRPLRESIPLAIAILMAVLTGAEDDAPGKATAAEDESGHSHAESSPSPPSTATPPPSASRRPKPTSAASGRSTPPS